MNKLSLVEEAALAYGCVYPEDTGMEKFLNLGISSMVFKSLKDKKMIKAIEVFGDVLFGEMLCEGKEHYKNARDARRLFKELSDKADCLMMCLAAWDEEKRGLVDESSEDALVKFDEKEYYDELYNNGLCDVRYADDGIWFVQVTDNGRKYVNGLFQEKMEMNNIGPFIINNNNNVSATAEIKDVTKDKTVSAINNLDIEQGLKKEVLKAVDELEKAVKDKNRTTFTKGLAKIASIIQDMDNAISPILLYVATCIKNLFG